jgi:AraC family transcriptional regulator, transcriptional activator of pobA
MGGSSETVGGSSVARARASDRRVDGRPVLDFARLPGAPPVSVVRVAAHGERPPGAAHAHDFLVLLLFERGGGTLPVGGHDRPITAGDLVLVAPGEQVGRGLTARLGPSEGWSVFFAPDAVEAQMVSWRAHPLLAGFAGGTAAGSRRLRVPDADRGAWSERIAALDAELRGREDGHREAALAHLTLLLVETSRLAADVAGALRLGDEPLLAAVFEVIDEQFAEPISLRDVAAAVALTPGHLTTVVGRRTGRTVQAWIAERRLAEARRLLAQTDEPVEAVGRRAGFRDPSYFSRRFRRAHGVTPAAWRAAMRH